MSSHSHEWNIRQTSSGVPACAEDWLDVQVAGMHWLALPRPRNLSARSCCPTGKPLGAQTVGPDAVQRDQPPGTGSSGLWLGDRIKFAAQLGGFFAGNLGSGSRLLGVLASGIDLHGQVFFTR